MPTENNFFLFEGSITTIGLFCLKTNPGLIVGMGGVFMVTKNTCGDRLGSI